MRHSHKHRGHGAGIEKRADHPADLDVTYVTDPSTSGGDGGDSTSSEDTQAAAPMMGVGDAVRGTRTTSSQEQAQTDEPNTQTTAVEAHTTGTKEQAPVQTTTEEPQTTKEQPTTTKPATTEHTAPQNTNTANSIDQDATMLALTTFSTSQSENTAAATTANFQTNTNLLNNPKATSDSSSSDKSATSPSATPVASDSGALSGGAKAGIAIGVVLGVGLIAGLIFLLVRRKQKQKQEEEDENEKPWGNHGSIPPPPPSIPIMAEPKTSTEPPQLNVRPITQFAPDLTPSQSAALAADAAGAGAGSPDSAMRNLTGNTPPHTPQSTRSGNPFGDPVNPFSNQAEAASPTVATGSVNSSNAPGANAEVATASSETVPNSSVLGATIAGAAVAGAAGGAAAASAKSTEKALPERPESLQSRSVSPPGTVPSPVSEVSAISADSASMAAAAPVVAGAPGPLNVHRVQMDFAPSMEDELGLRVGELVRLLHEYDDGWALCIRLDRSQQGVVPRSCLSSRPVKPRARPPPGGPAPRGPPIMGPNSRMHPGPGRFYPQDGRPMFPAHSGYGGPPRPQQQRPMSPGQFSPAPRPYPAGPSRAGPPRSMSPGPYGPPGMQRPEMSAAQRRRSNSVGSALNKPMPPPAGALPAIPTTNKIQRKPVAEAYF